jgi:hypothetical protein
MIKVEYLGVNTLDEMMNRLPPPKESLDATVARFRRMRREVGQRPQRGEVSLQQVMKAAGLEKPTTPKEFKKRF